jgi:hypothetical protein
MSVKKHHFFLRVFGVILFLIVLASPLKVGLTRAMSGVAAEISATIADLAGNPLSDLPYTSGESYTIDKTAPEVTSILRTSTSPTSSATIDFTIVFSENVQNVDIDDFSLITTGINSAFIANLSGSDNTYTVKVNTSPGDGTIRLDILDNATIIDQANNEVANLPFTSGEEYTIVRYKPVGIPKLTLPKQNSFSNISNPSFFWNNVANADGYEIEIATDSAFTQITLTGTSDSPDYIPTSSLADGKYYWHVRALNPTSQPGKFSPTQYFTIDTTSPLPPVLTSPLDSVNLKSSPIFRWNRVTGAILYEFQYDNDADFSSPTYSVATKNTYSKPPAMPNGTFYWKVRTQDAAGNWSSWSLIRSFSISR